MRIVNKHGEAISAYLDSAVIYQGRGDNVDGQPYGIFDVLNGLALSFDGLNAYLDSGMFYLYGRQVSVETETLIDNFQNYILNETNYVIVYLQIDLSNVMNQKASVVIDYSGSAYPELDDEYVQNLYQSNYGIYRAPLAKFTYTPTADDPFSEGELLAPILDYESRAYVTNIRMDDTLGNTTSFGSLFNDDGYALSASNADALATYNQYYEDMGIDGESVWGYSIASETEKIGGEYVYDDLSTSDSTLITGARLYNAGLSLYKLTTKTAGTEYGYNLGKIDVDHLILGKIGFNCPTSRFGFALISTYQTQGSESSSMTSSSVDATTPFPEYYFSDVDSDKTIYLCTGYSTSSGTSGHHTFDYDLYWTEDEPDVQGELSVWGYPDDAGTEHVLLKARLHRIGSYLYMYVTRYEAVTYPPISNTGASSYWTYSLGWGGSDSERGLIVDLLYAGDAQV